MRIVVRHRTRAVSFAAALGFLFAAAVAVFPGPARPAVIESLSVSPYFFSSDRGDSVTFRFSLLDTAEVYLFVLEGDSASIVDTLIAGAVFDDAAVHSAVWRGVYFNGVPAPEDTFLAFMKTDAGTGVDSLYSPLFFIDNTTPQVFITLVDPGLIAPGSSDPAQSPDAEITVLTADPPPGDSLEVDVVIFGPSGDEAASLPERLVPANGSHKTVWNGETSTEDGLHAIVVTARDRASNSSSARAYVDVDRDPPTVTVTSPEPGSKLIELPDSVFGWAWDRHGVRDSIAVEYPGRAVFADVETRFFRGDTLFFAAPLADSILAEGRLDFRFSAVDGVGQVRLRAYDVTWDASAPSAPVLASLPPVVRSPSVVIDGNPGGAQTDVMRIYRNDELADTLFPNIEGQWPHTLGVEPGLNRIRAVMVDDAGNASPPSNTVQTTFDTSSGFYIPQPFRAGEAFQLNLTADARRVTLRVYDLSGYLVRKFELEGDLQARAAAAPRSGADGRHPPQRAPSSAFVSIPWDGSNGDGDAVRKGPLVAVAVIEYDAGSEETLRQAFMFEP